MAAYAALVSLMNTVDQVQNYGHRHLIFPDGDHIESLREKVRFLQDYLENYPYTHTSGDGEKAIVVEGRIADAANAAEDVIESHVVDKILGRLDSERSRSLNYELQKAIKGLDSVKKMVPKLKKRRGLKHQVRRFPITSNASTSITQKHFMVGFDEYLIRVMDWLTGNHLSRQIFTLIGMGGIGKTTLARSVYENTLIVQTFTIRAWVTISQEYSIRRILVEILSGLKKQYIGDNSASSVYDMDRKTDDELGQELYKTLSGRMYLIVMDDMWSLEAWDRIRFFFPDNNNRSRILVTTRLSNVAVHFGRFVLEMDFLDEAKSWDLFCKIVFVQGNCPGELDEIGKKVVKRCKGLPLSIVVIGGLLAESSRTKEYWSYVSESANSILSSGANEHCSNIPSLSYNHLPVHLKPCLLYMGCFPEDHEIHVPRLIKLWVAEGFLKPNNAKTFEDIGVGFLKDLVDRNLIMVHGFGSDGKIKTCKIHDLLRDLCLRVAREENFLHDMWSPHEKKKSFSITRILSRHNSPRDIINRERRIVIHQDMRDPKLNHQISVNVQSTSLTRSIICNLKGQNKMYLPFKLLRVLNEVNRNPLEAIYELVNLRYLVMLPDCGPNPSLASSISLLWNVQTIILRGNNEPIKLPRLIWEMPQLRHLEFDKVTLPDPQDQSLFVLQNLQTLSNVLDFSFTDEVLLRIPNLKRLKFTYEGSSGRNGPVSFYGLHNIGDLNELESLSCKFELVPDRLDLLNRFTFPLCLKKLTLEGCRVHWEDLYGLSGIPHLEVLKLEKHSVVGSKWDPVEAEFSRLKFLKISYCGLVEWNAGNTHFPVLESLVLEQLFWLKEIPSDIGEIPTLRRIDLDNCAESVVTSAKMIVQEQESSGNEDLRVRVVFWNKAEMSSFKENMEAQGFASDNFRFDFVGVTK